MASWDLPDIYAHTLRTAALGLGHIIPPGHGVTITYPFLVCTAQY